MTGLLLAEYATAKEAHEAARLATEQGRPARDVLSPHPIEGIDAFLISTRATPVGWVMVIAGILGGLAGFFMQWYSAVIDYPINSGGRPLNSWPAFLLVPYETIILGAAIAGMLAWIFMCKLPALFHPLFEAGVSERGTLDRYLLVFESDVGVAAWIEASLQPRAVHELAP